MDPFLELIDTFWQNMQSGTLPELSYWNYLILFLLVVVEGPIVTLFGGAAASAGVLKTSLVFATVALGNLVADLGWYSLGYYSNVDTLLRYGRWVGLRQRHLTKLRVGMQAHAQKILLVAKLSTGFVIPTLVAAGLSRVPFRRWFPVVFAGEMFWTSILLLVGYHATQAIKQVERGLHYLAIGGSVVLILLIIYLLRRTLSPTGRFATGEAEMSPHTQRPSNATVHADSTLDLPDHSLDGVQQQNGEAHVPDQEPVE